MNDAWNLFRLHRSHERVEEILRRSGLYDVVCLGRMQYDRALVTAMVERWRPETHCFHLPFGEVTITLQDVQVCLVCASMVMLCTLRILHGGFVHDVLY